MISAAPRETPLTPRHRAHNARMAVFAGYDMPIQYESGIMAEHLHTRSKAGLFDVSHMGQAILDGPGAAATLESLCPGDIQNLAVGKMRYTVLLNDAGGIIDDLMILRCESERFFLVVNASRKAEDFALLQAALKPDTNLHIFEDRALIALQGPRAIHALSRLVPGLDTLGFLAGGCCWHGDTKMCVTRSGYTGEDGFELSIGVENLGPFIDKLEADSDVKWIGLGARDTLRLEAGLCLYGHELSETISPVEADLSWVIGKRRREAGDFPGAARILKELQNGPARKRIGILPEGRAIAREQTEIQDSAGRSIGLITSGGFGPSVNGPIAMGYVETAFAAPGTSLSLIVRGQSLAAQVAPLPFIPHSYKR